MESRVSYAAAGLFVLLLGAAFIGMGLWLGSDITTDDYKRYSVYFKESVSGLNANAPVKYRGVTVGRVENIELAKDNPERVHLVIAVREDTPVKTDTLAKLDPQGVTGILHLELTGGTQAAPPLVSKGGKPYPVIESTPSFITQLDQAVTEGLATADQLAGQISQLLNDQNQQNLSRTLANLERFSAALAANTGRMEKTLIEAEAMLSHGAQAAQALPTVLTDIRDTLDRFNDMTAGVKAASQDVSEMAAVGQAELIALGQQTLPEVNRLVEELQVLTDSLTRLSEDLRDNPRMLIFGRPERAPGPGE